MDLIAVAMADTPGLPPGVEEAAKRLATDGGITGALLVLALAAILGLWWEMRRRDAQAATRLEVVQKAHEEQREDWQRQTEALHERRFVDMQQVLNALNSNTGALNVISQTQADRTASLREVGQGIHDLILIARGNSDALRGLQSTVTANGTAIERLVWHGGIARPSPTPPPGGA
ncbi:hypothetical protein [Methylobacterium sp. Gmos1]